MAYLKTLLIALFALLIMAPTAFAEVMFIGEPEQWNRFISTLYKQDIIVSGKNITAFVFCEKEEIAINPDPQRKDFIQLKKLPYGEEVFTKVCGRTPRFKNIRLCDDDILNMKTEMLKKIGDVDVCLTDSGLIRTISILSDSSCYEGMKKEIILRNPSLPGQETKTDECLHQQSGYIEQLINTEPTPRTKKIIAAENLRLKQMAKKMESAIRSTAREMGYGTDNTRNLIQAKCYTEPNEQGKDSIICSLRFPTNYSMDYMTGEERREYHNIKALTKTLAVALAGNKTRESFFIKSSARFNGQYTFVCGFFYNKEWDILKQVP